MGWGRICVPSPCPQPSSFLQHLSQINLAVQPETEVLTPLVSNEAFPDESGGAGLWCESRQPFWFIWSVSTLSTVFVLQVDVHILWQVCSFLQGLDSAGVQRRDERLKRTTVGFTCLLQVWLCSLTEPLPTLCVGANAPEKAGPGCPPLP